MPKRELQDYKLTKIIAVRADPQYGSYLVNDDDITTFLQTKCGGTVRVTLETTYIEDAQKKKAEQDAIWEKIDRDNKAKSSK